MEDVRNYNLDDLRSLLRKDQNPDLDGMIRRVVDGFRYLSRLTELETALAADQARRRRDEAAELVGLIAP
jgi:hypothetical protein